MEAMQSLLTCSMCKHANARADAGTDSSDKQRQGNVLGKCAYISQRAQQQEDTDIMWYKKWGQKSSLCTFLMYTARKYQIINNKQGFFGTKKQKGIKKLCYNMQ